MLILEDVLDLLALIKRDVGLKDELTFPSLCNNLGKAVAEEQKIPQWKVSNLPLGTVLGETAEKEFHKMEEWYKKEKP